MATPSLPPSSTASPSQPPSIESTLLALDRLVECGLNQDDIVALMKLGSAGVGRILDMLEQEGRLRVDTLLGSLEGVSETTLGRLIVPRNAVAYEKSERGRRPSINPPQSPIDNPMYATPIPTLATPYLRPPLPSHTSRPRSTSTPRSAPSVSSKGSSSTGITNPSSHNRVEKRKTFPKSARRQLYCPDCKKDIKNGFDKHFRSHMDDLVGLEAELDVHEAFGCGYCHAQGVLVEGGKVCHGVAELVQHIKDAHASIPQRLHWDISHSFNHTLSAQPYFRRKILEMIDRERQSSGNHNNTIPSLSWVPDHRQLLRRLQIASGRLDRNLSFHDGQTIDILLKQVFEAAAQNWQQPFAFSSPSMPQHVAPMASLQQSSPHQPPRHQPPDMSFVGIGGGFDTPTPRQHNSFENEPSILSPSPQAPQAPQVPQHDSPALQHSQEFEMIDWDAPSRGADLSITENPPAPPVFAFDDCLPYSTPPLSQEPSMYEVCKGLGIEERDLYRGNS